MAKLFGGELVNKVIDRCLQFHGGYGYIEEYHDRARLARHPPVHHRRRHQRDHEGDHRQADGHRLRRARWRSG